MSKHSNPSPSDWVFWLGWGLLLAGILLYIVPLFYAVTGFYSGLFAFCLIFIGVSLLRYRKDQLNR